jgi:serine/threonine protein kinase
MTDADVRTPVLGEILDGRYRLEDTIGSGGMATVYRGTDELLGRTVAVKLFRPGTAEATDTARTSSETRTLASLNHPALVTLFDARIGTPDAAYLVMEYVDGPTLSQRIAGSPLPADEVAVMGADLAEALHVVHSAGIVHRDLKPSNILLRPTTLPGIAYRAKLADFGIAYLVDSTRLTTPGTLVGTAAYVSPEQVGGAAPATPADIYALGLVLIESLTGQRVYGQTALQENLLARLSHPPTVPGLFGYEWKSLLTAMTARNPGDRPTAHEVATTIARMGTPTPTPDVTTLLAAAPTSSHGVATPAPSDTTEQLHPVHAREPVTQPTRKLPVPTTGASLVNDDEGATGEPGRAGSSVRMRTARRRIVGILVVIALVLAATVIALWLITQNAAPPVPQLPTLPEPLGSHLDQLLHEVTP